MAKTNNEQFKSKASMDTFADWFCLQIQFKDFDVKQVKNEMRRIYNHFENEDGKTFTIELFMITHEKALDECDNNHIHIFLSINRKMRLQTMLNYFCKVFGYNPFAISIDKCCLKFGYLRYCLHIDGDVDGKHLYSLQDVTTNISYDLLETYIDSEDDKITTERLVQICYDVDFDTIKIMQKIGIDAYRKLRSVIQDIRDNEYRIRQNKKPSELLDGQYPF